MKHLAILTLFTLNSSLFTLSASAAVPLKWTVETSRATPAQFEAYQGETIELEATLQSYGKPLEAPSEYSLYWQTNGMGSTYWSVPCPSSATTTNVLFATWSPTNDVGAKIYNCFIGQPGTIYHVAFQLRLRPSPGANPNELPLPVPVIDFAKVTVLNPPWSGGGVDTNAVRDIVGEYLATNGIRSVDGEGRYLPPYLHYKEMDDTYPEAAAEWFAQADYSHGSCSARRTGNLLERNYDWNFDFMPEFVISIPSGLGRFASIAVCNVGTNLTEADVVSGMHLRWLKALPGHAVDGVNENGVVCEVNVVGGNPQTSGWRNMCDIHPLGAVRWALDNGKTAEDVATNLATRITFPDGWTQNFHYMVADERETWIVENGRARLDEAAVPVLTNFRLYPTRDTTGEGQERYDALVSGASITSQWWTLTYTDAGYRASDIQGLDTNLLFRAWAAKPKEFHRGENFNGQSWWQTVHTSVYDITNRTLRVAVQETDDWYTFAVPSAGGVKPEAVREIVEPMIAASTNGLATTNGVAQAIEANEKTGTDQQIVRARNESGVWIATVDSAASAGVAGRAYNADAVPWSGVGNHPTTLSGYGITDGATKTELSAHHDDAKLDARGSRWENFGSELKIGEGGGAIVGAQSFIANQSGTVMGGYGLFLSYVDSPNVLKDGTPVVYSISVNGGAARRGNVSIDIPAPGNYAAVSNAAMNAVQMVTNADANLIFTITSDGAEPRFYFTPVGAINPED